MNSKPILFFFMLLFFCTSLFAQEPEINIDTGFPVIKEKPYIVFNEGLTTAWVTRLIKQDNRSNFVFKDFFAGAYFAVETKNMQPMDSVLRLAVYYPLSHKFNRVPQAKKKYAGICI